MQPLDSDALIAASVTPKASNERSARAARPCTKLKPFTSWSAPIFSSCVGSPNTTHCCAAIQDHVICLGHGQSQSVCIAHRQCGWTVRQKHSQAHAKRYQPLPQ